MLFSVSVCWFILTVLNIFDPDLYKLNPHLTDSLYDVIYDLNNVFLLPMFLITLLSNYTFKTNNFSVSLSLKGRMPRSIYWLITFLSIGIMLGMLSQIEEVVTSDLSLTEAIFHSIAVLLFFLLNIWVILSINVQRWHDLNKSDWYTLIQLIPIVGPLIAFVKLGFKPGTQGFGENPLKPINDNNEIA